MKVLINEATKEITITVGIDEGLFDAIDQLGRRSRDETDTLVIPAFSIELSEVGADEPSAPEASWQ